MSSRSVYFTKEPYYTRASERYHVMDVNTSLRLGHIELELCRTLRTGTVHYSLNEEYWGQGYGKAVHELAEKLIRAKALAFIVAPILSVRAYRMLEKLGKDLSSHEKNKWGGGFSRANEALLRGY